MTEMTLRPVKYILSLERWGIEWILESQGSRSTIQLNLETRQEGNFRNVRREGAGVQSKSRSFFPGC
jgi:hypothetical protein